MGRRLVLGDTHGRLDYLEDVLKKANFDFENDTLIQIGDIVDRGPEPFKCMDVLLRVKNLVLITGNHDAAFIQLIAERRSVLGHGNGVEATLEAWNKLDKEEQIYYLESFFGRQVFYHVTKDGICFVHGGFNREELIENQVELSLCWDRELVKQSMSCTGDQKLANVNDFKEIFIGHTPTIYWNDTKPISRGGVINVDTGSGKGGPLTIMDVDTKEYWQSDLSGPDELKMISYGIIKKDQSNSEQS